VKSKEYAAHRGISESAVTRLIRAGVLSKSVSRDARGAYEIDAVVADQEYAANADQARRMTDPEFREAKAERERWAAKLAELRFKREAGQLVLAASVGQHMREVFTVCRSKLLGVPSRFKATCPEISHRQYLTLENLVREALEELSNGTTTPKEQL
jgi:hypothetical protein